MSEHKRIYDVILAYSGDPFFNSIRRKDIDTVQKYLRTGFSPDYIHKGKSALEYAIDCISTSPIDKEETENIFSTFLQTRGHLDDISNESKLKLAIINQDLPQVREVLKAPVNLSYIDGRGKSFLFLATSLRNRELIQILLEAGADVNQICVDNLTALVWAVIGEDLQTVKTLLSFGANPNLPYKGDKPFSILEAARRKKNPDLISILEDAGAVDEVDWGV